MQPTIRQRCGSARLLRTLLLASLLAGCTPLPDLDERTPSRAFTDTAGTLLGRSIEPLVATNPGTSGVVALADGPSAFAARMRLADAAERSLDVQYYIWHDDFSGTLLFDALRRAADRGVRVRLLLDDNNTSGLDPVLAALDAHPNISVRLFNPFMLRSFRPVAFLFDFARLNRRMHNKSFTADNQATIVGGRNVGDEYFGANDGNLFVDLDVFAIGPVVQAVSRDFDRYWASASSYPAALILPRADEAAISSVAARARDVRAAPLVQRYLLAMAELPFVQDLMARRLEFEWAPAHLISDDPAKGLGLADESALLPSRLRETLGRPQQHLDLVSSYFVPAEVGTAMLTGLAHDGVVVEVLTNSLAATDVLPVHAGYARRRRTLLENGVTLFELKPGEGAAPSPASGIAGSSASSLHAKTFSVDGRRVFIGSFNFDPRSARLNTEMGLLIDSPTLAGRIAGAFDDSIPQRAYRVQLTDAGELEWIERRAPGEVVVYDVEPETSLWQRALVRVIALLPVEWLL